MKGETAEGEETGPFWYHFGTTLVPLWAKSIRLQAKKVDAEGRGGLKIDTFQKKLT